MRWMESARVEMFRIMQGGDFKSSKIVSIMAWQNCKCIFPVTFPDTVIINLDVIELMEDCVLCEGKIYSTTNDRIVAISKSSLKAYDSEALKKTQFSRHLQKIFPRFLRRFYLKIRGAAVLESKESRNIYLIRS
jgi:acyl-CoA thioester hydrolase